MSWHIIRHPNGSYTRYSDTVDNFVEKCLTETEAWELCRSRGKSPEEATNAVIDANNNPQQWDIALDKIRKYHGEEVLQEMLKDLQKKDLEDQEVSSLLRV